MTAVGECLEFWPVAHLHHRSVSFSDQRLWFVVQLPFSKLILCSVLNLLVLKFFVQAIQLHVHQTVNFYLFIRFVCLVIISSFVCSTFSIAMIPVKA